MSRRVSFRDTPEPKARKVQEKITEAARITARAHAADRSTMLLPIIVAETLFIGAIAVASGKSSSGARKRASSDTVFVNVESPWYRLLRVVLLDLTRHLPWRTHRRLSNRGCDSPDIEALSSRSAVSTILG